MKDFSLALHPGRTPFALQHTLGIIIASPISLNSSLSQPSRIPASSDLSHPCSYPFYYPIYALYFPPSNHLNPQILSFPHLQLQTSPPISHTPCNRNLLSPYPHSANTSPAKPFTQTKPSNRPNRDHSTHADRENDKFFGHQTQSSQNSCAD